MIRRTLLTLLLTVTAPAFPQATDAPPAPLAPVVMADQTDATQISGVIAHFLLNPNGDVDGLLLAGRTQVNVPPTVSRALTASFHIGDVIHVTGYRVGATELLNAQKITDASGRTSISEDTPASRFATAPPALQPMQAIGQVSCVIFGPRADVVGVLLDDGTSLRLPPPAAGRIPHLLVDGQRVSAQGFGVVTPWGRAIQVTAIGPDRASEQTLLSPPEPRASSPAGPPD